MAPKSARAGQELFLSHSGALATEEPEASDLLCLLRQFLQFLPRPPPHAQVGKAISLGEGHGRGSCDTQPE
jgi:hypothetical protein